MAVVGSFVAVSVPAFGDDPECTKLGTEGDDVLVGTSGNDVICGFGGNDTITSGSGNDVIHGGAGADVISGGSGNDVIHGEDGADQTEGGSGNDIIWGGAGDDALTGGSGNDELRGGPGTDAAAGGSGSDLCAAESTSSCETVVSDEAPPSTIQLISPGDGQVVFSLTDIEVVVTPAEAVGTVDLRVDDQLIDTEPIDNGSASFEWDTTAGTEGEVEVAVVAKNTGGISVSTSSVVVSVDNSLSDMERIFADFDTGLITVDEFAVLATESIYVPNRLDDRYGVAIDEDGEGTVAALTIEALWDDLSQDTMDLLTAFEEVAADLRIHELRADPDLDPRDLVGPSAQAPGPAFIVRGTEPILATGPKSLAISWPRTVVFSQHSAYWVNCEADGKCGFTTDHFRIKYWLASVNQVDGVPDDDTQDDSTGFDQDLTALTGIPNGIPDRIDHLAYELERALVVYDDMGYDEPPGLSFGPFATRIDVEVQAGRAQARRVAPVGPFFFKISVDPGDPRHTVRHEVFHHVQFGYFFQQWLLSGTPWWLESSADWAAHFAGESLGDNAYSDGTFDQGGAGQYAAGKLASLFGSTGRRLTSGESFSSFSESRVYGAFILSEYLEDQFDANDVRGIWESIRDNPFQGGASAIWGYDYDGFGFGEVLSDFWTAAYLLREQPEDDFAFDDPHLSLWREALGAADTGGDAQSPENRPKRTHIPLDEEWSPEIRVLIGPGGGTFLDLTADRLQDGGTLELDLSEEGGSENIRTRLIGFGEYPEFCMDPVEFPVGDSNLSVVIPTGCSFLTAQSVNTEDSSFRTAARSFRFSAQAITGPVNFDFETGDLTGWAVIDSGDGDTWYEIQTPGLLNTNYAFRIENTGSPIDGIEQTVPRQSGDCQVVVTTTGESGTTARLEVLKASDGSVWAVTDYTYTGSETGPVVMSVGPGTTFFVPEVYTVRLLFIGRTTGVAIVTFDEVEVFGCT